MIADYIANHQAEFWIFAGFVLLVLEVVTGFTVGVFLFAGLGALVTGLLMTFAVLPETLNAGISCTGISAGIIAALLWQPLKKLQGDRLPGKDNSSDFIGHEFIVDSDITVSSPGTTNYSGISWKVEVDKDADTYAIQAGQKVVVTSVEVGKFKVKPLQ